MATTTTTLTGAVTVNDRSIAVTAATNFAAGSFLRIDNETLKIAQNYTTGLIIPVLRGQDGTATAAHPSGANVTVGTGVDFSVPAPGTVVTYPPAGRGRTIVGYGASGAIAHPSGGADMVAVLNGTSTLAMTLAAPTKDIDGSMLIILGSGKSASTVTAAGGFGLSASTVLTAQAGGVVGMTLMAMNGAWVVVGAPPITGTSTAISFAVS